LEYKLEYIFIKICKFDNLTYSNEEKKQMTDDELKGMFLQLQQLLGGLDQKIGELDKKVDVGFKQVKVGLAKVEGELKRLD